MNVLKACIKNCSSVMRDLYWQSEYFLWNPFW